MEAIAATPPVNLASAESAGAALAVYGRICDQWGLSAADRQALLGVRRSTWYRWAQGNPQSGLDPAVLERLSYVFRIYAALKILLPVPERANAWVTATPNTAPLFGGKSALHRMLAGQVGDLKVVADYLDAQRGGDFS